MSGAVLFGTSVAAALAGVAWGAWLSGAEAPPGTFFGVWGLVTLAGMLPGALVALARGRNPPPLGAALFGLVVGCVAIAIPLWVVARLAPGALGWSTPTALLVGGWIAKHAIDLGSERVIARVGAWVGVAFSLAGLAWLGRPSNASALANSLGDVPLLIAVVGALGLLGAAATWRRGHWLAWVGVLAIAAPAAFGVRTFVTRYDDVAYTLNLAKSRALRRTTMLAQPLFDGDGDGYARILGGHDCDDANPEISPGAVEVPGNGVDDDCFDGDAPIPEPVVEVPPEPVEAEPPAPRERPNLVLVTIDTIRQDRLGYAGYERPTSPNLDALSKRALTFEWAFSQGPQTRMSMPSVFTGRYMSEVARTPELWARIHEENVTIAERLRDVGYRTAAVPCHRYFLRGYGLHQGFDHYDLSVVVEHGGKIPVRITGGDVTDRALAWLDAEGAGADPFFLWVHYFDPHHFYQNHAGVDFGREPYDRYDEEIWFTDQQIGRLLTGLDAVERDTYVIVHGDHAESVGEHKYTYHGQTLFNDQVHTPLLVAGPGIEGKRIKTPVSNIDIAPTLLDLAQQPVPGELRGRTLLDFAHGDPVWKPVLIEMIEDPGHAPRKALVAWPWKIHWMVKGGYFRLHNLAGDPKELRNVVLKEKDAFKAERKRIRKFVADEVKAVAPKW